MLDRWGERIGCRRDVLGIVDAGAGIDGYGAIDGVAEREDSMASESVPNLLLMMSEMGQHCHSRTSEDAAALPTHKCSRRVSTSV